MLQLHLATPPELSDASLGASDALAASPTLGLELLGLGEELTVLKMSIDETGFLQCLVWRIDIFLK